MAKKKKTRQQKIIADLRRKISNENLSSQNTVLAKVNTPQVKITKKEIPIVLKTEKKDEQNYAYLKRDLRKTAILTGSVVAAQIILFLVLTNKLIILPGLSY